MLPHRLNLLSPEKIQHLKRMVTFQFIKNLLEMTLFFFCLAGITLLGGQILLQDYFFEVMAQTVAVNNRYANTNKDIREINSTLDKLDKIQKEDKNWSETIISIANALPVQVTLSGLNINKINKQIIITGTAATRQDLLLFRDQINNLGLGRPIEIPAAQLTAQENILFSFTISLK